MSALVVVEQEHPDGAALCEAAGPEPVERRDDQADAHPGLHPEAPRPGTAGASGTHGHRSTALWHVSTRWFYQMVSIHFFLKYNDPRLDTPGRHGNRSTS